MELTRRDAVAALAALGAGSAVGVGAWEWHQRQSERGEDRPAVSDETVRKTMLAVAAVVYPSDVSGTAEFVETFLAGRLERDDHAEGLRRAVAELNERGEAWYDAPIYELEPADRDSLLREVGADTAEEDPAGRTAERVRYYVVNDLLLALYSSPTGGDLVGLENPQGHAGGTDSYQRGPSP